MTICPCCGFKFEGLLAAGCHSCGARAVGEALPRPAHELPSYGRSLVLASGGALMILVVLVQTIVALAKNTPIEFGNIWLWIAAAETAAWKLKWVALPVTLLVIFGNRRIYRSIKEAPSRFCGLPYARFGFAVSIMVLVLIAVLIGVTVPERLHQRTLAREAASYAVGYTFERALQQYREKFGTLPADLNDLRQLPDEDHSIAAALNSLETNSLTNLYRPTADLASKQNPRPLRGAMIRKASLSNANDELLSDGLSFTNYELRLAGEDKLMGTDDDLLMSDGVIKRASEVPRRAGVIPTGKLAK